MLLAQWWGFGAVYEAQDMQAGQRIVALKETFDKSSVAAWQAEFTVMRSLSHPNLPKYYALFESQQISYLVMEYIEGQSLADVQQAQGSPLIEAQVLAYALQLCDALQYLHSQTPVILHRDIKPANIRITPAGLIKLVDFGLLKQGTSLTGTMGKGLTPAYAPPEQYSGGTDPRSDIFSLGATLYHLLTGVEPTPVGARMSVSPDPLVPPRQHNSQLSPHVEQALLDAMSLLQQARPTSIGAFRRLLIA
jgi:eukaryotic-like serine/threonine-protein kinase